MNHFYELKINSDNELNLKYIEKFLNLSEYNDKVSLQYDLDNIEDSFVLTEESLTSFINDVNENIKPNLDSNEIKYYGLSHHNEIHLIGAFDSTKDFLDRYYEHDGDFEDSIAADYIFYFTYDSIQDVIIHFKDIINTKNITSNEVVQFDDYLSSFDNELKLK